MTEPISFSWTATPDPAEVTGLLDAVYAVDGRPAPEPDASLPGELRGGQHLFARRADAVVGYAHLNEGDAFGRPVAELFVRPPDRGAGIGAGLAAEVAARAGVSLDDPAADRLRAWSHGDHPAAAGLARRLGFERVRELLRMRRALPGPDEPEFNGPALALPTLPEGVRLRAFVPGQDEAAVVAVNHRAFDWHPEQGAMTEDEVREAETEPWFDPAGFLLAVDASDKLLGFHWTKVHAHGAVGDQPGVPMGEVYVVGVDPAAQGGGLGRALTVAGLRHLADKRGLDRVMLYTEGDNTPAIRLYERLGFARWDSDVQYAH